MRRFGHRFRFQVLHEWLVDHYQPCKAADVGGGKGLLAYFLNRSDWECTVIDPVSQPLPRTFRDLDKNRIILPTNERQVVPRISKPFEEEMAQYFDLLIGLHAHGSNLKIIDACKKYHKKFVLLPCCVVDEPITIQPNINWFDSLVEYAQSQGFKVHQEKLNFVGQSTVIYTAD